ncbi:hypothetical protein P8631_17175, partial [Guyparkeria sp. 1SP6A2]|nr:hypothetical protein [Guyparkeria sp. 1SP6A2]
MSNWQGPTAGYDPANPPAAVSTIPGYDPQKWAENARANRDKMDAGTVTESTLNDNRADNRQFPMTNNIE